MVRLKIKQGKYPVLNLEKGCVTKWSYESFKYLLKPPSNLLCLECNVLRSPIFIRTRTQIIPIAVLLIRQYRF